MREHHGVGGRVRQGWHHGGAHGILRGGGRRGPGDHLRAAHRAHRVCLLPVERRTEPGGFAPHRGDARPSR